MPREGGKKNLKLKYSSMKNIIVTFSEEEAEKLKKLIIDFNSFYESKKNVEFQ